MRGTAREKGGYRGHKLAPEVTIPLIGQAVISHKGHCAQRVDRYYVVGKAGRSWKKNRKKKTRGGGKR